MASQEQQATTAPATPGSPSTDPARPDHPRETPTQVRFGEFLPDAAPLPTWPVAEEPTTRVEYGSSRLTLSAALRLEPGMFVPLQAAKDGGVRILLGQRLLAVGELVEVGGQLAVLVRRIPGQDALPGSVP